MRKVRNQKGFTIMELMIVIVIIGILIAIAVPAYKNFTDRANRAACNSNQRTIESARGLCYADTASYGSQISDLSAYIANGADLVCPTGTAYTWAADSPTVTCTAHAKL